MIKSFVFLFLTLSGFLTALSQDTFCVCMGEKTSTYSYPVGELNELWQFPSDHLPVGGTVGEIHFVMWNILGTKSLHEIMNNSQGLRNSLIIQANQPILRDYVTVREALIINNVLEMICHPTRPRSLLALEEAEKHVYTKLQESLPCHMKLVPERFEDNESGNIFIYDTNIFEFANFQSISYSVSSEHAYATLTLIEKKTGLTYRFIQTRIPKRKDLSNLVRKEFSHAIIENFDADAITIVMGDMNHSSDYFLKDLEEAADDLDCEKLPFIDLDVPYATYINKRMEAAWVDNLFISNPYRHISSSVSEEASDLFENLQEVVELLESLRS